MMNLLLDHQAGLLGLASALSVIGTLTGLFVGQHISAGPGRIRWLWLVLTAVLVGGCATWAASFLAMIAYRAGVPMSYDIGWTIVSLALATGATLAALALALRWPGRRSARLAAGVTGGLGAAGMYYAELAGARVAAEMVFAPGMVAATVLVAIVGATAVAHLPLHRMGRLRFAATPLLALGVLVLHFVGMASVELRPLEGATVDHFSGALTPRIATLGTVVIVTVGCGVSTLLAAAQVAANQFGEATRDTV